MKRSRFLVGMAVAAAACLIAAQAVSTDSPAAAMAGAAEQFVGVLNDAERERALHDYDDPARLDWHFIPKDDRTGIKLGDASEPTRAAALELLKASLSATGYDKATTIMELESILRELQGDGGGPIRDPHRYYVAVFGDPSGEAPWGWRLEGHHLSLNFAVEGDQVSAHSPVSWGANPATVTVETGVGPAVGTRVLRAEEDLAFELLGSLDAAQRAKAVIAEKAPADIRAAGEPQPPQEPIRGIPASELNDGQMELLHRLIAAYAGNLPEDVAAADLAAIEAAGFDEVHFAWAGADVPGVGHYYCIEGPTFVVEFCNVQPDGAGNPANHIHTIWRNAAGDFGIHL